MFVSISLRDGRLGIRVQSYVDPAALCARQSSFGGTERSAAM